MRILLGILMLVLGAGAEVVTAVPELDFQKYSGTWYEIARLPNRFQSKCVGNVTATYSLREDGKLRVVNACKEANGRVKRAEGRARLASAKGPKSKLKVTFFWPFYGDYWVIDLDAQYRWAVVGTPDRKYFWILSRTKALPAETVERILGRARAQGFQLDGLVRTVQE